MSFFQSDAFRKNIEVETDFNCSLEVFPSKESLDESSKEACERLREFLLQQNLIKSGKVCSRRRMICLHCKRDHELETEQRDVDDETVKVTESCCDGAKADYESWKATNEQN